MKFWQDVICGRKRLFKLDKAPDVVIEKLPEFKVAEALKIARDSPTASHYLPDAWF